MVPVTIAKAQLFCEGKELLHPRDQQIAWTVMNYSDWGNSRRTVVR